ncbi:MAG: glycosyltransferase family 39 protein [Chloroflexi bacterium]|nr:glycosyltransferase family 39 protein [Chloroflexota bacterium]MCC6893563.1 glycosyltransferase family 39 protein [Anaerolineae bacterium]
MSSHTHKRWLYAILVGYVLLATVYSVVTPIFEASDELWHYPMVKYMADNGLQLPPQDPAVPAPWRQEGSQPPLYYMMAAVLTGWIDTSDMENARRVNPHADIGIVRPDGNANMMVHRTEAEAFPWRGTTLAVHIARFFSIVLGLGTVIVTYLLTREIFPEQPVIALGAAALNAFIPMFLFISGSVNNDNLSNLLGNVLTLLIVKLLKTRTLPHWRLYALLGVCSGAGLLAKLNLGFFMPVIALGLLILSLRLKNWRPLVVGGVISGGLTILIAGWWYWHNWQLYNDPTGLNMFLQIVGRRAIFANMAQIWSERHSFTQAYWGFFGGVNVPMPEALYLLLNIIGGIGLLGAFVFVAYIIVRRRWSLERWLPALITLLWPVVTFISYLRWTAETPASQGRLIFVAISAISMWMVVGWTWWQPARLQSYVTGIIGLFFALIAAVIPFTVIAPVYAQPPQIAPSTTQQALFRQQNTEGAVALVSSSVLTTNAIPEAYIYVETTWQIEQPFDQNWSLFAHLVTTNGVIIWQRDVYPGQGTLATSDLPANFAWNNQIAIPLPNTAYAPMTLDVVIGWYNLQTGERLILADGKETFKIGMVDVVPRPDVEQLDVPNPIRINFDNQIELVGYSLSNLTPTAGDTIELTLYWRGLRKLDTDYKVFANILDPQTLTKYAASDGMPVNWQAPTTTWETGTIIKDTHTLTVDPNTPPGIYETELGLYSQSEDGTIHRLRIVTVDGGMANDYMNMTRVRILPAGNS